MRLKLDKIWNKFFWDADTGYSLSLFRILFGCIFIWEFWRLAFSQVGEIRYFNTVFHFKYAFFEWLPCLPNSLLQITFILGLLSAIFFTMGFYFKYASKILFTIYSYVFLLDYSYWNNHYFLYVLLLFVLCFTQANVKLSIDKRFKLSKVPDWIPCWQKNALLTTISIAIIFGALSKFINPDWLNQKAVSQILNNSFQRNNLEADTSLFPFLVFTLTYAGFLFDLLIVPVLLYRKTFWLGVLAMLVFNLTNMYLLSIGSFPIAMLGTIVLFYPFKIGKLKDMNTEPHMHKRKGITEASLLTFICILIILPFNHFFIDGNVFWTSEGKVGAWHMMSGSTKIETPFFMLVEKDEEGKVINTEKINTDLYLNSKQLRTLGKKPFLVHQFAQFIKLEAEVAGFKNVSVYGDILVSRNGRRFKPIIDINYDLTLAKTKLFEHQEYVLTYLEEQ